MKTKEIRELSLAEIEKTIRDERDKLLRLRLHKTTGQVERTSELKMLKLDIARLETVRREKLRAEGQPA